MKTSPDPVATELPQATGSPMRPIGKPLAKTVEEPAARMDPCVGFFGHP
mgnify:FL=1